MFIVCSGADSYRSLEKARKSVERLPNGKDGIDPLLSLASGASLFSERRFIRVDGITKACPKARRDALLKMLSRDPEMTIVVSVEEGDLKEKDVKDFKVLPKYYQYDFSSLAPPLFQKWATAFAKKNGMEDAGRIQKLISVSQGDSWLFVNEFWKMRAGGEIHQDVSDALNIFEVIDAFLQGRNERRSLLGRFGDTQSVMAQVGNQARSLALVQAGRQDGIHPFVVKKLSRMRGVDGPETFRRLMTAFTWSRTGSANADEAFDVLG
jgi:hypothetical protein